MKNGFDEKVKGHGFFRKTKAFGLASGIALGAALLIGANTVSADEATPAQPTTTAQPTSSDTKTEVVTVKEAELKAKVDEAKKAGVEVVEKPAVSVGTATNDADAKKLEAEATKKVDAEIKALDDAKAKSSDSEIAKSQVENKKKELLKSENFFPTTTYGLLADVQLRDSVVPSLANISNFKSSKGDLQFFKASTGYYRTGDNAKAKTTQLFNDMVKAGMSDKPTALKFYADSGNYTGDGRNSLKDYIDKRLNKDQDAYIVNLRDGEEVSWDINIPSNSLLNSVYGISKVHQVVSLSGGDLPPEVYAMEVVTPYLAEGVDNHLIHDASNANRAENHKFTFTKTNTFYDKNGKIIPLSTLFTKYVNSQVFNNKNLLKESEVNVDWFKKVMEYPASIFANKTAKREGDKDSVDNEVHKAQETIIPIKSGVNQNTGTYTIPSYVVQRYSSMDLKITEEADSHQKVEVSPVTYTRATAITTTYVPNDKLNPGETKVIDDGKQSGKKVIEVGIKPSEKVEETPFKEETRPNPALPEGERKVVQEGVKGRKVTRTTYTLDTKTGKVTPKEEVTENSAPKNRIIEVGTKPVVMEKEIPFKETVVQNPSKPEGTRTVLKEGKVGKETTTTTYALDTRTGKVTPDTKTTVVKAEDRLVEVGTGKNVTGDVETQYVPDPELEPGQSKVVQEGTPEVKDVTGKVLTPGKPTIIHIGTKPKVVEEELPFKEEVRENKDLPKGERKVVQEGKVGKKVTTTTYTLDPKTGKVTSTDKVEETAAVNKIIEVGTKEEVKATPAPQSPAAPKAQLPHTGTEASLALTLAGLAVAGIATTMVRKKKEQ